MRQLLQWIVITAGANQQIADYIGAILAVASGVFAVFWQVNNLRVYLHH